jgi:2-succinyl-6-hydroxy-2,4-cyclohexadiene-1-carboxylate synthase
MFELSQLTCGNPSHPPLIFLHGFLGGKEDWEDMLPYFQNTFFCIALDLPGHGGSLYSEDILSAVKKVIFNLSPHKPIGIGYSMGGRIALQLQECFSSLAIISAHPGLETEAEREARRKIDQEWSEKMLQHSFAAFFTEWYAQPIFQNLSQNTSLLQKLIERRLKQNPQHLARVLLQMSLANQPHIVDFSCPTLFLYGEGDWRYQQLYCRLPKTVTVSCIKNCGHAIHLENPACCAKEILNWLENIHAYT